MKKCFLSTITILLLAACGQSDKQLITEAEALVEENPDSALVLLNNVEDRKHLSGEMLARYWMAMAYAHKNADQAMSEDSMVLYAIDYYQKRDSAMLRKARALASSYYWWRDSLSQSKKLMIQSMEESRRAGNREETVSKLRSLARMASLERNLEEQKHYTNEVIKLNGGDENMAALLNSLAIEYYYHGKTDSAIVTLERAIAYRDTAKDSVYVWRNVMRNYADLLIDLGQYDKGIQLHEQIMEHYRQSNSYEGNEAGSLFSLSHAWLLKGDKQKARQYLDEVEEYETSDATYFCVIGHRMVLNYATTGRYNITDMAEYANEKRNKREKSQAIAEAKEKSIQMLREHELMLTVSRQRQLIFFLLLTLSLVGIIIVLFALVRHRKKLLVEKEKEMLQLNELLAKLQQTKEEQPKTAEKQLSSAIVLTGNTSEIVNLEIAHLLYIEAVGNYVKVYRSCDGKVKIDMLRATLKQVEDDLRTYPTVVRCHRAFLVNLNQVERIESHANSTQLLIKYCNDHLPVSRSNMAQVKAAIKELA